MPQSSNGPSTLLRFLLSVLAASILIGCASGTPYREQDVFAVKIGMTKAEVEAIVGPPTTTRYHAESGLEGWYWENSKGLTRNRASIVFRDGKVVQVPTGVARTRRELSRQSDEAGREIEIIRAESQPKVDDPLDRIRESQIKAQAEELAKRQAKQAKDAAEDAAAVKRQEEARALAAAIEFRRNEDAKIRREIDEKNRRLEEERRAKYLANPKLTPQFRQAITEKKVMIGMTADDVTESWGAPTKKNVSVNEYGRTEQWVYAGDRYLYFTNGKLKSWQLSE